MRFRRSSEYPAIDICFKNYANHIRRVFVICLVVAAMTTLGFGQGTTGTLRGQVLDPSGAVVANGTVTVVNEATQVSQSSVTTSSGTYNFPNVLPGSYMVTIEAKGFKKYVKKGVPVGANQDNVADAHLELGSTAEVVEVVAGNAQVETTSSTINNEFDSKDVLNVPVVGGVAYSALNLSILAPNTTAQPGGAAGTGGAIGGTRPRDNNFTIDGVDDNNLGVTGPNSTVIFDAIGEFHLLTNQYSAEYGHSAGGQFAIVTKTGTNNYHGTGEWYSQNRNFNSLDNLTKAAILADTPGLSSMPAYDNNRWGGTFGGPLIKNKLFFFGAYERTFLHGTGAPTQITVPTADGLTTLQGMAADASVTNILNNFPAAPSASGAVTVNGQDIPIGSLTIVSPVLQKQHDVQFNTDYTWGKHQFGTRFLLNQGSSLLPVNDTQAQFNQSVLLRNRKIALTDTWSLRNNVINDLRLQYSYYGQFFTNPCGSTCPSDVTFGDLGNSTIGPSDPQFQKQSTYQVSDNLTWIRGKHSLKFGGQYTHYILPQFFLPRSLGDYWYSSLEEFINDQLPSQPGRTLRGAGSGTFLGTQSLFAGFVQDDIKVTPRLTLNLGLRYEYWTNPVGTNLQALNSISSVPGVITFGKPKTDYNNIGPRIGFAWDPTGRERTSIRGGFGISYDVKFQNFASITLPPQVASEMDPATACTISNPPAWCSAATLGSGFLASGGLPGVLTPPANQAEARNLTTSYIDDTIMPKIMTWSLGVQHELMRNTTVEVRYLGTRGLELPVQYRRNFTSYFDAGGQPLPMFFDPSTIPSSWDASTPTDTAFNAFNPNTYAQYGFNGIVTGDPSIGSSIYHAGSVNLTHRAGHGFTLNTNYTYSHTISDSDNEFNTSALNPRRAQDTNNLRDDRASSELDVRHKFALSLTYDFPKVRSDNHVIKTLADGFSLGTSVLAQSGQPVTLQTGFVDANGNGDTAGDRASINPFGTGNVLGEPLQGDIFAVCEDAGGSTYIAATSFSNTTVTPNGCNGTATVFDPAIGYTPANPNDRYVLTGAGSRSNLGRNSFRSPGFWTWNLALYKNFNFSETMHLQFGAQAFNVLNHANYALSNGNVFNTAGITTALATQGYVLPTDPTFLQPQQFGGGIRSMILTMKFVF
jgi:outer membrane receptor protein involved in Fe transport